MLHRSNQYEIAMANLAKDRSDNQAVKDYADLVISDHKKADDELQSVAAAHNVDLQPDLHAIQERHQEDMDAARSREVQSATGEYFRPMPRVGRGVSGMSAEHQKAFDDLGKLKGSEFDRRFAKAMADDHGKVIDHLKTVRANATERDLTQLIDKLLPTLQKHETIARQLESA
jgi:putative membrane protein